MTEQEWLANDSPHQMLEYLNGVSSDRKMRLFAVACCYHRAHMIHDERVLTALRFAEGLADGPADEEAHITAFESALQANDEAYKEWLRLPSQTPEEREARWRYDLSYVIQTAVGEARPAAKEALVSMGWWATGGADPQHLALLHDIFGNPFRGVSVDPSWLTSTVVELARPIYDERAFDRLPILADALQDAGCDSADVLGHCRGPGPHARGCWVVDLVLGKQ